MSNELARQALRRYLLDNRAKTIDPAEFVRGYVAACEIIERYAESYEPRPAIPDESSHGFRAGYIEALRDIGEIE